MSGHLMPAGSRLSRLHSLALQGLALSAAATRASCGCRAAAAAAACASFSSSSSSAKRSQPATSTSSSNSRGSGFLRLDPDEDESSGDDMVPYDELLRQIEEHPEEVRQPQRRSAAAVVQEAAHHRGRNDLQLPPEHTHGSGLVQRAWTETDGHVEKISRVYPELTPEKIREIDAAVDEIFAFTMLPRGYEEGMDTRRLDALALDEADLDHWWETHPKDSKNLIRFIQILAARGDGERIWATFQHEVRIGGFYDAEALPRPPRPAALLEAGRFSAERYLGAQLQSLASQQGQLGDGSSSASSSQQQALALSEEAQDVAAVTMLGARLHAEQDPQELDVRHELETELEVQAARYRRQALGDQSTVLTHDVIVAVLGGLAARGPRDRTTGLKPSHPQRPELSSAERSLRVERAWEVVRWMKRLGLSRSEAVYGALIHVCGTWGDLAGARRAFEEVRQLLRFQQEPRAPNVVCWTALMNAYVKDNRPQEAWRVFNSMRMAGVRPDQPAFDTAMRLAAEENNAEKAIDLMQEMRHNHGIDPTLHTYCNLMLACSNRPDFYLMTFRYFDELIAQGFVPNRYVYNILLRACTKHGDLANALLVMREMNWMYRQQLKDKALSGSALRPDELTYTTMIQCIARTMHKPSVPTNPSREQWIGIKDRLEMVENYLREMRERGLPIGIKTINCVVLAYGRCGNWSMAEKRLQELTQEAGLQPNYFSYLVLMRMYCMRRDVPRALSTLERIKIARMPLDYTPYGLLLKLCRSKRLGTLGKQILAEAEQLGFRVPSRHAYHFRPEFESKPYTHSEHPDYDPSHPYNIENFQKVEELIQGHSRSFERTRFWEEKFPIPTEKGYYRLAGDRLEERPLGLPLDVYSNEVRQITAAQEKLRLAASAGAEGSQEGSEAVASSESSESPEASASASASATASSAAASASAKISELEETAWDGAASAQEAPGAAGLAARLGQQPPAGFPGKLQEWEDWDEDISLEDLEMMAATEGEDDAGEDSGFDFDDSDPDFEGAASRQ